MTITRMVNRRPVDMNLGTGNLPPLLHSLSHLYTKDNIHFGLFSPWVPRTRPSTAHSRKVALSLEIPCTLSLSSLLRTLTRLLLSTATKTLNLNILQIQVNDLDAYSILTTMSAPIISIPAATTPFSYAASLAHYETRNSFELMIMAKLRCISDAGGNQEIIARLMAQDEENGTWPGKHEEPGAAATKTDVAAKKKDEEELVVAPVKQVLAKEGTPSETEVAVEEKADHAPPATISKDITVPTRSRSPIIPLSQLAHEWDEQWGASYAFPRAATAGSKFQDKSVTRAESVSSGSKSPVTPTSPVSQASPVSLATPASSPPTIPALLKSNPYILLMSDEKDDVEEEERENEGLLTPVKKNTGKAPIMHKKVQKTSCVHEKKKEIPLVSSDDVDAGYKIKTKNRRGKKGGKQVNENNAAEVSTGTDNADAVASSDDTAAATTKQPENLPAPVSPARCAHAEATSESKVNVLSESAVVVRDFGVVNSPSPSPSRPLSPEKAAHKHDVADFYNMPSQTQDAPAFGETFAQKQNLGQRISYLTPSPLQPVQSAKSTKNTPVQTFVGALPSPPSPPPQYSHAAPSSSAPAMTKSQWRNEKHKQDQAVSSSNMYDALVADDTVDADEIAFASGDTDDERDGDSDGEAALAPKTNAKKNRRRGKKGGKKVQAMKQKVNQAVKVPVVVQQTVAMPAPMKMEMSHVVGAVAVVMLLVALLGAQVLG